MIFDAYLGAVEYFYRNCMVQIFKNNNNDNEHPETCRKCVEINREDLYVAIVTFILDADTTVTSGTATEATPSAATSKQGKH